MSSAGAGLFQLRKELHVSVGHEVSDSRDHEVTGDQSLFVVNSTHTESNLDASSTSKYDNTKILTENEKYIVKRLPAELSMTNENSDLKDIHGMVDTVSHRALINDLDYLYMWDYKSSQRHTTFGKIALHDEHTVLSSAPLCLFTRPVAMDSNTSMCEDNSALNPNCNRGICIINRKNSQFLYYEDVDSINNLYSQLSKSKAYQLDLKLKDGEEVTMAINCEPSGIVIATSIGRLLFVTIRDSTGKTKVQLKQQLIKPQIGFLFKNFNASKEIVSLKLGPIMGKGERLLYVSTIGGDLEIWQISVTLNSFKRISLNIYENILESLEDLYPFAHGTLKILDSHPLFADSSSVHLILSSITDGQETYYILSTIILDEQTNSFNIFSTYRLTTYVLPSDDQKPKLCIPSTLGDNVGPVISIYVLFSDAAVLTQISSKFDSSYPLRRKWEDVISFNKTVEVIGSGYDATSLYIICKGTGVLKISINNEDNQELEVIRFVKSHIDQAVYFSYISASPIEFNLQKGTQLDTEEIEHDLIMAGNEIFRSTGKYIPPLLNTLEQHLNSRIGFYKNLISFTKQNFNYKVSPQIKLQLLEHYEIMNSCLNLWNFIKNNDELLNVWNKILYNYDNNLTIETLILNQLEKYPKLFTSFLEEVASGCLESRFSRGKSQIINLLISCLYDGVLEEGEKALRYDMFALDPLELGPCPLWFINYESLDYLNQIFFDYKFSIQLSSEETNKQLLTFVKLLYYMFQQSIIWLNNKDELSSSRAQIEVLYNENHKSWCQVLHELGLDEDALQLTEFYHDLESLVEILESLDFESTEDLYAHYFEIFRFEFASTLFKYYIAANNLQALFFRFPEQREFLVEFLFSSPEYYNVAWIQEIFDKNYEHSSKILSSISVGQQGDGKPLEERELQLNIAKLTALTGSLPTVEEDVNNIQINIDIIGFQRELMKELEAQSFSMKTNYSNSEFSTIFRKIIKQIKEGKSVSLTDIVEVYSMGDNSDDLFNAIKLLSSVGSSIDYEIKKYLTSMIWRRSILFDIREEETRQSTKTIYQLLVKVFENNLFEHDILLPIYSTLVDRSVTSMRFLTQLYGKYGSNIVSINDSIEREFHFIEQLGSDFHIKLLSVIGSANEATGNKCTINYETNTIEY